MQQQHNNIRSSSTAPSTTKPSYMHHAGCTHTMQHSLTPCSTASHAFTGTRREGLRHNCALCGASKCTYRKLTRPGRTVVCVVMPPLAPPLPPCTHPHPCSHATSGQHVAGGQGCYCWEPLNWKCYCYSYCHCCWHSLCCQCHCCCLHVCSCKSQQRRQRQLPLPSLATTHCPSHSPHCHMHASALLPCCHGHPPH